MALIRLSGPGAPWGPGGEPLGALGGHLGAPRGSRGWSKGPPLVKIFPRYARSVGTNGNQWATKLRLWGAFAIIGKPFPTENGGVNLELDTHWPECFQSKFTPAPTPWCPNRAIVWPIGPKLGQSWCQVRTKGNAFWVSS